MTYEKKNYPKMSEHRWDFVRQRQSLVDQCPTTDCYLQPFLHSARNMVMKLLGLSVTADPKVQIRGGRNEFTLDTNIFQQYVHTSITTYCH